MMKSGRQIFKFKQFDIAQEQTAMKVGTDGVLLGAWVDLDNVENILDVGTGTGLIALMCAQRKHKARIDAVEIEPAAARQAMENFENSKWKERLNLIHTDFKIFIPGKKYDTIISNPPYFDEQTVNINRQRNLARHSSNLSLETLIQKSKKMLSKTGSIQLILPIAKLPQLQQIIRNENLFLNKICYVKGHPATNIKRIMVKISNCQSILEKQYLTIELSRHHYTDDYIRLTHDFYLNMP